jgi:hypothetical protein
MGATLEQSIEVKIKALVSGLKEVQKLQTEIKGIEKLAGKKLSVNTSEAERGFSRLTGLLRFFSPTADAAIQKVEGLEKAADTSFGKWGKVAGVLGAVGAGLFLLTKIASDAGSEIKDLTIETGYSAETISALKNSVETAGGTIQDVTPALGFFNVQLAENIDKGSKASTAFKLLGKDINNNETALRRAFQILNAETNATKKAQLAKEYFSRSYRSVLGIIEATNGNLDLAIQKYRDLGRLIDTETAEAADRFGDEMTEAWQGVKALGISIGTNLMPVLRLLLGVTNLLTMAFRGWGMAIDWVKQKLPGGWADKTMSFIAANVPEIAASQAIGNVQKALKSGDGIGNLSSAGGGGGKGKRPDIDTFDSKLSLQKTQIESGFTLTKDALDRENKLVEEMLADRLLSITQFYTDVRRIQAAALDEEERKLGLEKDTEKQRFDNAKKKINGDEDLTGEEKKAKIAIERNKSTEVYARINERLVVLSRERAELDDKIKRDEKEANAEFQKQLSDITNELREAQGRSADAEASRIGQRFKDILTKALANSGEELTQPVKDVIAEIERLGGVSGAAFKGILDNVGLQFSDMSKEVQDIIELIDLLIRKSKIAEGLSRADQIFETRNLRISEIEGQRQGNYLAELRVRREINEENKKYINDLEDIIRGLEQRAELEKDPQLLNAVRQRRIELERLKKEQESFGQLLKDTAINSAVDGLTNMFANIARDASNAKEYVRDFFASFLEELNRVIIRMLVMKAIMAVLGLLSGGGDVEGLSFDGFIDSAPTGLAEGDMVSATPGGRLIQVAEGGYDEVVLTTDPKHRSRTERLLAMFLSRTGLAAPFARGGFISGESILSSVTSRIPRLAAGDFISNLPEPAFAGAEGGFTQINNMKFPREDARRTRIPSKAAFRDAMRTLRGAKP